MRRFLLIPAVAMALAAPAAAQVTVGSGAPDLAVGPLGVDSQNAGLIPTAIAQTFFAPPGASYLQSFTFFLSSFANGGALKLNASVYAFSADHLIESALFTSPFNGSDNESDFDAHLVGGNPAAPLNILLTPGAMYALVLSAFDGNATTPDPSTVVIGATSEDTYGGPSSALFVSAAPNNASLFKDGAFLSDPKNFGSDMAFSATFTSTALVATPEPATFMLLATGLVGVGVFAKRRRRR